MKADVKRPRASLKVEIYRQSRLWHGYLSAFAFLALIFFAATGLILNHPEWFPTKPDPRPTERTVTLTPAELAAAQAAADPSRALAIAVARQVKLRGAFQSGEILDDEAQIRLEGVTGSTDILVDLKSGKAEVSTARTDLVTTLNELHRGKNAGAVWKAIIDASAVLVLALSLIGYVLFFSLRFRLRTSLILTGASLAILFGVFWLFVP
jgi:hypothetical protein